MDLFDRILRVVLIILLVVAIIGIIWYMTDFDLCNCDTEFQKTVKQIHNEVKDNFKYRVNPDSNILNDSELFKEGGDCLDWARYYQKRLNESGIENERVTYIYEVNGKKKGHTFVIAYASEGYFLLDQETIYEVRSKNIS